MDLADQGGLPRARIRGEQRVTPLELFFDLVFALTQVAGMLQGGALLAVLYLLGHNAFRLREEGSVSVPTV